jgi:Xaa-Pro aminopeptidase
MSFEQRRRALGEAVGETADAYLVSVLVNVRYLTGFTGSNAAVLVSADGTTVLATDGRYATQAGQQSPDVDLVVTRRLMPDLVTHARDNGLRRIAIERHGITLAAYDALRDATADEVEFVDGQQAVEQLRTVKDAAEIDLLTAACRITDEAFAAILGELRPGVTELDIAWRLREEMRRRGAEPAFDSIVAFGPNSAEPHHEPTNYALQGGDLVKVDFGARVGGYHADMTRTVCCGPAADWQRDLHGLVAQIQRDASAEVRPGAVPVDLNTATRLRIEAAGHDVAHGLGHGVGLEIHESPFLVEGSTAARLVDRVAVTVEPGIYLPGRGGVRIEDTVLVSADGAESLTTSPRELIEI